MLPVLSGKPEVPETKLPEQSDLERSWSRGRFYCSSRSRIPELVGCTSFGFLGAQLSREIIRLEVIDSADRAVIELIKPALLLLKLGDPRGPEWAIRSLGKVFEQIEVQTDSHSFTLLIQHPRIKLDIEPDCERCRVPAPGQRHL